MTGRGLAWLGCDVASLEEEGLTRWTVFWTDKDKRVNGDDGRLDDGQALCEP